MEARLVYITTESPAEARAIGAALVEARLAACVNIIGEMTSIFRWEGEIQEGKESILIAKTTRELVAPLTARVKEMHGYSCPCVVALPILDGNPDFLRWIEEETADEG